MHFQLVFMPSKDRDFRAPSAWLHQAHQIFVGQDCTDGHCNAKQKEKELCPCFRWWWWVMDECTHFLLDGENSCSCLIAFWRQEHSTVCYFRQMLEKLTKQMQICLAKLQKLFCSRSRVYMGSPSRRSGCNVKWCFFSDATQFCVDWWLRNTDLDDKAKDKTMPTCLLASQGC